VVWKPVKKLDGTMTENLAESGSDGFLTRFVGRFLQGHNAVLMLVLALSLGVAAIFLTPREEEPQIVVPMADLFVEAPGYSAQEIERLVVTPLERLLWQTDGVEHVYSVSQRDQAMVTVRFFVGEDREDSLVKLRDRMQQNRDQIPSIVTGWIVKPVEIDDVPIVTLALYGQGFDQFSLRRIGEEVQARLDGLHSISRTQLIGGARRELRVEINRGAMEARGLTLIDVADAIRAANRTANVGTFDRLNQHISVSIGEGFTGLESLESLVLSNGGNHLVYLRDIATLEDRSEELNTNTRIFLADKASADGLGMGISLPSVTLAVSKQKGSDATRVAAEVLAEMERLRAEVLPAGLGMRVTRNYGETADEKVNNLLGSIGFALLAVVGLLLVTLGWREALIVALVVPVSFALALFVNAMLGYTINRVTLFALILSLGLVVDDPITNVDNIQRHLRQRKCGPRESVLNGVREVLPPVIMSTLTIIVSFLPMFFITGMMGPYMAPMAANVPLTVAFSTLAAVTIVPWLALKLLKHHSKAEARSGKTKSTDSTPRWLRRGYRATMVPILRNRWRASLLLGLTFALFLGASSLPVLGKVPLKMLPFDNKNELQLMVDLPEGSTLEHTDAVVRRFETYLAQVPEVKDFESYVGIASPMDFNGMVRHSYLRKSPELADIRVNLVHSSKREMQSHAIAMRIRDGLQEIAAQNQTQFQLVETPPGPPVLATIVAEVYGEDSAIYEELLGAAYRLKKIMEHEPGLRETDVKATAEHDRARFILDRQQAAIHGVNESQVTRLVNIALAGEDVASLRVSGDRQPLPVQLRLPRAQRSGLDELKVLGARTSDGAVVSLQGIGAFGRVPADAVIYHKNLQPVVYVTAEMVGRAPGEAVLALQSELKEQPLPSNIRVEWAGEGEWEITLRVFRDMGLSYLAALLLIYLLLTVETKSLVMPLLVMMAIPLTAIGMMPGFWMLNSFFTDNIGPYHDAVFFTATAMIGMIALGGIVVRNSLVLLQFIQNELQQGKELRDAIYSAGAVRMRPILLTAGTTALGAWPITLDPIFSGLAWALIFGLIASTAFTLLVVPAVYWLISEKKYRKAKSETSNATSVAESYGNSD
jgi:multidrug efflux pump subunit AcrB